MPKLINHLKNITMMVKMTSQPCTNNYVCTISLITWLSLALCGRQAAALKIFFSFVTFAFFSYSNVQNKYVKDTFYTLRDAHPGTDALLWRRIGVF